jgi:hypothetical protein
MTLRYLLDAHVERAMALGETIENLLDAASLSLEEEYRDQIRHLPL